MALVICLSALPVRAEPPRVVTSIKPVHSLAAMVLDGIADPYLIVKGAASPHGHALRPSDAKALADAHAVFWIGPELETFLVKPLQTLSPSARVVALMDSESDDDHDHTPGVDHGKTQAPATDHDNAHDHGGTDPHIWLSPEHAVAMIERIAGVMSNLFPAHADRIAKNRIQAIDELVDVDAEVRRLVRPMLDEYVVVLHEAYGHFTEHYGLRDFVALSITPEHKPTPGRVSEVKRFVRDYHVRCVFAEPQFPDTFVRLMTEGTRAIPGVLDPLGAQIAPGPDLYPQLLRLLGFAIRGCYEETL